MSALTLCLTVSFSTLLQHHSRWFRGRSVLFGPVERGPGQTVQLWGPGHLDFDRCSSDRGRLCGACRRFSLHLKRSSVDTTGLWPLLLHAASLRKDWRSALRCCVFSTFSCPSSLLNMSSSHLLTRRKCFPLHTSNDSTHTNIRSIPVILPPSPVEILQMELCRRTRSQWLCVSSWFDLTGG